MLTPFDTIRFIHRLTPPSHIRHRRPEPRRPLFVHGHQKDGAFFFAAAMGHYPVRGVVDGAFSVVRDGVEHSIFAFGHQPPD